MIMNVCLVCHKKQQHIFAYQGFDYSRCRNCQLVSTYPLPSTETIEKHYAKRFAEGNYRLRRSDSERYKAVYDDFVTFSRRG